MCLYFSNKILVVKEVNTINSGRQTKLDNTDNEISQTFVVL